MKKDADIKNSQGRSAEKKLSQMMQVKHRPTVSLAHPQPLEAFKKNSNQTVVASHSHKDDSRRLGKEHRHAVRNYLDPPKSTGLASVLSRAGKSIFTKIFAPIQHKVLLVCVNQQSTCDLFEVFLAKKVPLLCCPNYERFRTTRNTCYFNRSRLTRTQ